MNLSLKFGIIGSTRSLIRFASNVTVIGCGVMGSGIAAICASAGYNTNVLYSNKEHLNKCEQRTLMHLLEFGKNQSDNLPMARIKFTTDLASAVFDSQMVIEAIIEDLESKRQLFSSVERLAPKSCVFASNTSSLLINEIAAGLSRKEYFGGMHFFNPVKSMKLVEIIRSNFTSENTSKTMVSFAESLGKTVVHCKDTPGFIVSRLLVPYLLEAIEMQERLDASVNDIDSAMRLGAAHPLGPFELADYIGLDTLLRIIEHWVVRHPEERAFRLNATLRQLVADGRFGKKCGYGFYKYDQRGRIMKREKSVCN